MATIINADTSNGLKLTSDTSGIIQLQSGGTTKATVNSSGLTSPGHVLQVVETSYKTAVTFNVADFTATGLTASITPSSTSNKVLIMVKLDIGSSNGGNAEGSRTRLYRGASNLTGAMGTDSGNKQGSFITHPAYQGDGSSFITHYGQFLDSPSTTSSTTYTIYIRGYDTSGTYPTYLNRSHTDSDVYYTPRGVCVMTLMEVAG